MCVIMCVSVWVCVGVWVRVQFEFRLFEDTYSY